MEIKIPFYNIINMLLTGLLFVGGCMVIFPEKIMLVLDNEIIKNISTGPEIILTVCVFAIAYEIGLIINRLGSILVETILKKTKLIPFDNDYAKFNRVKIAFPIMGTLSREYALSRTGITLYLLLAGISGLQCRWEIMFVCLGITAIYYFSCRKHSSKIVELMKEDKTSKQE